MAKIAIVTGSDSGIGKATAVRLARDGFDVGITWHGDRAGAEDTAREVLAEGRRAAVTRLDVTDHESAGDVVEALAGELGGLATRAAARATRSSTSRSTTGAGSST